MKEFVNCIYNEDCVQGMSALPEAIVDLVVTDPPFGIDFEAKRSNYNRTKERVLEGYCEVPKEEYATFTLKWMSEAARLLKKSGAMFIFSGWNNLKDILVAIDELQLTMVNHIIWKYQFGVATKRRFVTSHYHCLYVCKNDSLRKFFPNARHVPDERDEDGRSMRYRDMEDVWVINREYWTGDLKTPTKLPAKLIEKILSYTSEEGDLIMDPFLGSGQTAVVAKTMGRRYLGFEIVPEYYDFSLRRLQTNTYRPPSKIQREGG